MKRSVTAIIVCLILTLCLAACGADKNDAHDNTDNVQIPAPWTDYASAEEASAEAGFTIETPESIGNCGFDFARVFDDGMLELFYTDGNGSGVSARKAAGDGDISGDYNEYSEVETMDAGGAEVTIKGNGDGISLALWADGGYTYAVSSDGFALTADEVGAVVNAAVGGAD